MCKVNKESTGLFPEARIQGPQLRCKSLQGMTMDEHIFFFIIRSTVGLPHGGIFLGIHKFPFPTVKIIILYLYCVKKTCEKVNFIE